VNNRKLIFKWNLCLEKQTFCFDAKMQDLFSDSEDIMEDQTRWDSAGEVYDTPSRVGQQKPPTRQVRRIGTKPPPDRAPRSIYCFTLKNPLRKLCLQVRKFERNNK